MANSNIASIGRFSSQMLTYLGTQKTVKYVNNVPTNTFKYASGPTVFPNAGSLLQSTLGFGVVGNYSPTAYDSTKCFFLSRGVGPLYADTMTGLAIDMASQLGISSQALLEQTETDGTLLFTPNAYRAFNNLRDPGNQVGVVTTVDNRFSLQARQIRS
ncbi:MAG TPA: hypothetical protein VIY47_15340 [Ignavibacteriaceae bacterium]